VRVKDEEKERRAKKAKSRREEWKRRGEGGGLFEPLGAEEVVAAESGLGRHALGGVVSQHSLLESRFISFVSRGRKGRRGKETHNHQLDALLRRPGDVVGELFAAPGREGGFVVGEGGDAGPVFFRRGTEKAAVALPRSIRRSRRKKEREGRSEEEKRTGRS
jgi:hypothetical protein